MTTNEKIDVLGESIAMLNDKLDTKFNIIDRRFDGIDCKLLEHDEKFRQHDELLEAIGSAHVELAHKLDIVIQQTSEIPQMSNDITYLKIEAAHTRNDIGKINDRLIKMETKDDYLLERMEKLDERMDKIGAQEYA